MDESRYTVPLDDLERSVRTTAATQVEVQAEPRLHEGVPQLHPFGDGASGDADGD